MSIGDNASVRINSLCETSLVIIFISCNSCSVRSVYLGEIVLIVLEGFLIARNIGNCNEVSEYIVIVAYDSAGGC